MKTNHRPAIVGVDRRDGLGRLSSDAHMSTRIHRGRARLDLNRRSFALVVLRGRGRPVRPGRRIERIGHVPLMCLLFNGRAADRISVPKGGNHRS